MTTHRQCNTRLYRIWRNMKQRCNNPRNTGYEIYGGKGVFVCQEWSASFIAFRDWALANGYSPSLTLDRRKSKGGYTPDNCRWATGQEQTRNKTKCRAKRSSQYKGVYWAKHCKMWRASIGSNYKDRHLGYFKNEQGAAFAYNAAAVELFGEYAALNIVESEKVRNGEDV